MYREAIVLYSTRLGTEELQPDIKTDRATDIDTLPLVIHEPQPVRFCDRIYSIEREGLYRFIDLGWCRKDKKSGRPQCLNPEKRYIRNLIHFREDVGSLFQALSRLHVGGSAHQSWSIDKLIQQAMRGRLSVSCGRISEFTCELLKMQNVRCRLVGIVTLEEWKTTGFGHTMFEYFDEKRKKWILGDISMRCLFMKGKAYLNLYQLTNAVRYRGDFRIKRIVGYPICNIDPSSGIRGEFDLSVLSEEIKATEASVKRWFQRTAYVPLIEENERWWFWAEDQKERKRIENCASFYSYLPKEEWLRRFYPNFQEVNHAGG